MNRLFYKGLWNKGQCILNFNVYLGVVSQPKTSGTVKSFNFNMSDLSSWDSNVTFPFLLQCAPGVIPYFGPERLERVDRMIIKVPPTHLIIWQYLVGEVGDERFKEKLKQVETQLNENPKNWVLPSKVGIEKYWTLLKNDKSLPHKLLNLSNLITFQKYIYIMIVEFEDSTIDTNVMRKLLKTHYSIVSKKQLRKEFQGKKPNCLISKVLV